jgi:hypothetical protein
MMRPALLHPQNLAMNVECLMRQGFVTNLRQGRKRAFNWAGVNSGSVSNEMDEKHPKETI